MSHSSNQHNKNWVRRHPIISAVSGIVLIVFAASAVAGEDTSEPQNADKPAAEATAEPTHTQIERTPDKSPAPEPESQESTPHKKKHKRKPKVYQVSRVVDGDTIELVNGKTVRLVGIDTPERGDCGYDKATRNMERMVLGENVRLIRPGPSTDNRDRYGRLLRYVAIGHMDTGLRQIKRGLAIARYDALDGYGYHPRQSTYHRIDDEVKNISCPKPAPTYEPQPEPEPAPAPAPGNCADGYSPCIPPYPPDLDCADVNGPIHVSGSDPHGLDADGDGVACET